MSPPADVKEKPAKDWIDEITPFLMPLAVVATGIFSAVFVTAKLQKEGIKQKYIEIALTVLDSHRAGAFALWDRQRLGLTTETPCSLVTGKFFPSSFPNRCNQNLFKRLGRQFHWIKPHAASLFGEYYNRGDIFWLYAEACEGINIQIGMELVDEINSTRDRMIVCESIVV